MGFALPRQLYLFLAFFAKRTGVPRTKHGTPVLLQTIISRQNLKIITFVKRFGDELGKADQRNQVGEHHDAVEEI